MEVLPDGTMIRSVLSPYPLGGLMIIYDDVTDRLELEQARNTTQAVRQAILDHLLEGLAVFGSVPEFRTPCRRRDRIVPRIDIQRIASGIGLAHPQGPHHRECARARFTGEPSSPN